MFHWSKQVDGEVQTYYLIERRQSQNISNTYDSESNFFLVNKLGLFSISLFPFFLEPVLFIFCVLFFFFKLLFCIGYSLVAQMVKNSPAMRESWVKSLGWEDPLEKGMATHSSILVWRIPWTEEPGGLQPMELQRLRHDRATNPTLEYNRLQ